MVAKTEDDRTDRTATTRVQARTALLLAQPLGADLFEGVLRLQKPQELEACA